MRYAGAIMIFLACAGGGFYKAMQIKSRVRTLSSLIAALEVLKGEIADRLSDLPTALENTRGGASGEAACFIGALCQSSREIGDRPFADIWRQCAQEKLPSLRENELSALISLGGMLGRYDGETQAQAIDACRDALKASYSLFAPTASSGMRAAMGAGVSIGLMITITLF